MTMTNLAPSEAGPMSAGSVVKKAVFTVTERGDRSYWTRIGAAFTNKDGSLTVRLDAVPVNGTLQIRDEDPTRRFGSNP